MDAPFIHLKLHSLYSLCEGAVKITDLIQQCEKEKFPAVAITDTNNMFGVLEFSIKCKEHGIQPIIGSKIDCYINNIVAPLTFICTSECGYKNLMKLMTSFYSGTNVEKRYITLKDLSLYNKDLIILSGAGEGVPGQLFVNGEKDLAINTMDCLYDIFKDNFYIELSRCNEDNEKTTEEFFINYAIDNKIPLVATNEVFFLNKSMHVAHDALLCIADGTYISVNDRRKVSEEHYLKSSSEMYSLFNDIPEAVLNTHIIAQKCHFMPEKKKPMLPRFHDDDSDSSEDDILERKARNGLAEKLAIVKQYKSNEGKNFEQVQEIYNTRFEYELKVIKSMGFSGYFLIVSDFVKWSKDHDIPVGPGRGSGAGSIIAWCMHITELDPIKYTLLFERFLNPERISMPDFDIDFCQYRRDETIEYVQSKYGKDRVAHIIALGKLQARNVVRDVGRVLQMSYNQVDKITKLVPQNPVHPIDLRTAIEMEPKLTELMENDTQVKFLIETALQLEGLCRHASMHAAGIVIGNENIDELVPIYSDGETPMAITQFNMKYVEMAGLVKFDFLGLKTLTVIQYAIKSIKKYKNIDLDISNIDMEDKKTFDLLCAVDVTGVFQLESSGMKDVIKKLQPDNIEDIIALISLYRPGPMDNIPVYLARKHGEEKIKYLHPLLEPILKPTYGVMIYQEQVMQIAQKMGGYSLAGADLLRRAMGKKIKEEMEKNKTIFEEGAIKQGIDSNIASEVFDTMAKFASYGFNRSHAAAYGVISYQTAYLKANFRLEFYIASLNLDIDNTDKITMFIQDAKQSGINILPLDINKSDDIFIEEDSNSIRYALGALKGSSSNLMQNIVKERKLHGEYKDIFDFFDRVNGMSGLNSRQAEILTLSGAFDSIHNNRHQIFESLEILMSSNTKSKQMLLFEDTKKELIDVPQWDVLEQLEKERQVVKFYLNNHPMELYNEILQSKNVLNSKEFKKSIENVNIAGILMSKDEHISKNGNKYCFITISDTSNSFEVSILSSLYLQVRDHLQVGKPYLIQSKLVVDSETIRITAIKLQNIDTFISNQKVFIHINQSIDINKLKQELDKIKNGNNKIYFITKDEYNQTFEIDTNYSKDFNLEVRKYIVNKLNLNIEYSDM
ncbi:MAG: DNA polymerase III subunit alpha [Alphaproteobacteria bacterium]|nr:DNA polymerase III subunit alpha [Alphaproteobacteria bacterium]